MIIVFKGFINNIVIQNTMKQARSSNLPSRQFVTSTRVQADQKNVILDKLKLEADALRKNETEFAMLR